MIGNRIVSGQEAENEPGAHRTSVQICLKQQDSWQIVQLALHVTCMCMVGKASLLLGWEELGGPAG